MTAPFISTHTLERLREHYPAIGFRGARQMIEESTPMDPALVAAILQRSMERVRDHYRRTPRGDGIFVIVKRDNGWAAVTYLRLSPSQVQLLE